MTEPKFWLLELDEHYDSTEILGLITDPDEAARLTDALADSDTLGVREIRVLSGLTVETLWSSVRCSFTVKWDGRIAGDVCDDPIDHVVVRGIPGVDDDDWSGTRPEPCTVEIRATESGYRLGVWLWVYGSDVEQCRARFTELRARLLADPAGETIAAWVASKYLPRWTFGREENHALLPALADALRAAGKGDLVDSCIERGS